MDELIILPEHLEVIPPDHDDARGTTRYHAMEDVISSYEHPGVEIHGHFGHEDDMLVFHSMEIDVESVPMGDIVIENLEVMVEPVDHNEESVQSDFRRVSILHRIHTLFIGL